MSKIATTQPGWIDKLAQTCGSNCQPLLILIFLALLGWFGFDKIKQITLKDQTRELALMLDINVTVTKQWIESKKAHVKGWANYKDSHQELLDLIALAGRDKSELQHSKELARLRERLEPVHKVHGYRGFVVFDKSGVQIGALYDGLIGQSELTSLSDFVQRTLQGETVVSKPFWAITPFPGERDTFKPDQPTMFASTPIYDKGEIVGVFAFRLAPNEFTQILEGARFGETGETYAFDSTGMMISDSRFNDQLKSLKIIPDQPDSRAMLTVRLNVPGEKQLNRMARSATKGESGVDINGYPDYRGIPVVGAWTWLPEHGFGVATETDTSEAYKALSTLQALFAFSYALIVTITVSGLILRKRERQAEESRQLILNSAGEGIFGLDVKGLFTFINPSAERMLSYAATELLGKSAHAMIHHSNPDGTPHPENECAVYAAFHNGLRQQVSSDVFWRKDGTCLPVEYISTPIFKDGKLKGAVVTFNDITQRVQADAERKHAKQIMRIFIEHAPAPVAMFDRDMRYLAYSRRWLTDYGLGSKNITGLSHYEVFPEIQEDWKEIHHRCLAGAVEKCNEDKFVRQDGTTEWLSWEITPWRDEYGLIGGIIMFTEVITERKLMEMALKENEQRLNMALHTFAGGDWEWNLLTGDVVLTPRWLKSIGYSPGELATNIDTWKQMIHPEDLPRVGESLRAYFAGEIPNYEFEYRLRSKSGDWQWRISRGAPISWDANGKPTYMIGTELDITERKKSEETYARLIEHLDATPDFVGFASARDTRVLFINQAGRSMTGLGKDEDITNLKIADVHPAKTNRIFEEEILPIAIRTGYWHGECEFLHRDGHTVPVSMILVTHKSSSGEIEMFSTISRDITERKKTEKQLQISNELEKILKQAQSKYLTEANFEATFSELLCKVLTLTESEFGFIGEIFFNHDGSPYLKTHALTNIAWNDETHELYNKHMKIGMEFHNMDTLFGAVITSGEPVIANDPSSDPRRGGLPKGHPPLNSFLGLPFYSGAQCIGMIGMANRVEKFNDDIIKFLRPFQETCANLIQAYRNDKQRKQAEEMLQNANKYLELRVQERTAELMNANDLLRKLSRAAEQSPSSIIITDRAGKIEYVNPKFTQLSGFAPEEVIGKNPRILKSGKTIAAEYEDLWKTIASGGEWHGEFQNRKKNGDCYWGLTSISPIRDTQGEITHYISSMEDITERKLVEEKIKASLLEKEILMREINHRAKNNLQVISSLIKMQSRDAGEPRFAKLAQNLGNRIAAMTLVHDQILQSKDLNRIDTGHYIASLTRNILCTYGENGRKIKLNIDTSGIILDVETSIHCGLIINELLSNSLKYAFAPGQTGIIDIVLRLGADSGDLELIVHDNGAGIREDIDIRKTKSLGMRLVTTLAESQLQGRIELNRNGGTEFKIIFPAVK